MEKLYYSLVTNETKKEAEIYIFGDISSYDNCESSNMSAYKLSKIIKEMADLKTIHVHISSYGGEVKEGLAIYNVLKSHPAKVITYDDGFACSIASVIFMAGEERIMTKSSLLMIHNAWVFTEGDAKELRKQADDLDKITQASINIYMQYVNLSEEELKRMLDEEYWLDYNEAIKFGFATKVQDESKKGASQSVKNKLINLILQKYNKQEENKMKKYKCTKCGYIYEGEELPEYFVCPECGADKESFEEITEEETEPEEKVVGYKCTKCDYVYEGEKLPEYFVCPECGADKESFEEITEEETEPEEKVVGYKCTKCDYVYEGEELPEYFVCPECGADKESFEEMTEEDDNNEDKNKENEKATKNAVAFFNAMIGGMK